MVIEEWGKVGVHIKPQKVTHDGGGEFKKHFEDICHLLQADRRMSIGDRPEGRGMIEKFNRDVVQLIAKMCPSTVKKPDAARSYVTALATAVEAHNSAIHNPLSQESVGGI